jgi:subtilisin family serine protease
MSLWYNDNGNPAKKLVNSGEAAEFFDMPGWVSQTYWSADGTITSYASAEDSLNNKPQWHYKLQNESGVTWPGIETYEYYSNGWVRLKNIYQEVNGVWTWVIAYGYQDQGPNFPFGNVWSVFGNSPENVPTTIPGFPEKPQRSNAESMSLTMGTGIDGLGDTVTQQINIFYDGIEELKSGYSGDGIKVAVLDSGIDKETFSGNVSVGYDFVERTADFNDVLGHGTKMAEVISHTAVNSEILDIKVLNEQSETTSASVSEAIHYAVDMGAKVISMSFSLFPISTQLESAIDYAFAKGAVMVAAAGNSASRILESSLAAQDKVFTVGSVGSDGKFSAWNNYGSEIDLYAPWDVIAVRHGEADEVGTSFSAAFVAGLAALIIEENPDYSTYDVLSEIKSLTSVFGSERELMPEKSLKKPGDENKVNLFKGVSVDVVLTKYDTIRQNRNIFSPYGPKMEKSMAETINQ